MMFRLRCACLLLCPLASASVGHAQLLRGRWITEELLLSFDFRGGDTVWQLIPIAAVTANGRGTYEYGQGRLILHYGEGLSDTAAVTLRGDTMLSALGKDRKATWARVASVRGARSPLHGTWVGPCMVNDCRLITYLPGGLFFQEAALVGHYTVETMTVTITTQDGQEPLQFQLQIRGADTVLTRLDGAGTKFRRPKCEDPRLDPRKSFISACS